MSITTLSTINEQLLKSIGVGIAIVRFSDLHFYYHNKAFAEWFGDPASSDVVTEIVDRLREDARTALQDTGRFTTEVQVKPKRRTLVIALTANLAEFEGESVVVVECQNITRMRELEQMIESYSNMVERNTRELEREKERVEKLLLNLMPRSVYEEFKTFGVVTPQLYRNVSVLMLDFVGFTSFAENTDPTVTLGELNDMFTAFDRISEQFGCERIKTIGDAYLAVSGMPEPAPDHASAVANCAVRFIRYLERRNQSHQHKWQARIGLATGTAVGSVVGVQKYVYDVFGPAVNMAARLQVFAQPMKIVAPVDMKFDLIDAFRVTEIGSYDIKGLGQVELVNVEGNLTLAN
ncbi:adenylate/guanylate cyclase domain-containing protein [Sedimentitalea sp. JM2-8]|uniref:Adenylate/guanylate cyclase domain-containing protein n=1 Tax=Sedimentitalea xiamensis TaxID=3050037 RepID=A0ABT7FBR8_9RHOB|nr:adenylate/guanylate cyclase domain-containing protein [Sedimentitalea xiamensis]MDK3072561.1 adenylate/guanylate cyclase domain-containing protein [Sedimentitalea xiamensis]